MSTTPNQRRLLAYRLLYGCDRTEADRQELEAWIGESPSNRALYNRLQEASQWSDWAQRRERVKPVKAWEKVALRVGHPVGRKISLRRWVAMTASLVLLSGIGLAAYLYLRPGEVTPLAATFIVPGTSRACLVFSDGRRMSLGSCMPNSSLEKDGVVITADTSGSLSYRAGNTVFSEEIRHTLIVPQGGEYLLRLADSTLVRLNSMSVLHFPVHFAGACREVYLEGEGYFTVHRDSCQPFIVHTKNMDVCVKGTEFNVRAYPDESLLQTTLVAGAVEISTDQGKQRLRPAQQAEFNCSTRETVVKEVNPDEYTAWVQGWFVFKNKRLEDIMSELSRWYDFEVVYHPSEVRDAVFGGRLNRFGGIEPILDIMKATFSLEVAVQGRTILFTAK